uniref:Bax inhibitor-1/YccA family protein n=1 Tax=Ndongobacter massiliensis TaxID=1871025 RepID=UPI00093057B7|nr:Bax inhibitor-1/YccA family protein [Ndongobacter massiliensis]
MYYTDERSRQGAAVRAEEFSSYLSRVFLLMFVGLAVTTLVAVFGMQSEAVLRFVIGLYQTPLSMLVFFGAYLLLVVAFQRAVSQLNSTVAMALFLVYAAVTGFTWTVLFALIEPGVIWKAFLSAGVFFGVMALYGMTTKRDLSQMRTILFIGLIAILISSLLNALLFRSSGFDLLVSVLGVALFAGYTAYDVNKLRMLYQSNYDTMALNAIAVFGAFNLYLDFINLFIYLLRIFSNRRE